MGREGVKRSKKLTPSTPKLTPSTPIFTPSTPKLTPSTPSLTPSPQKYLETSEFSQRLETKNDRFSLAARSYILASRIDIIRPCFQRKNLAVLLGTVCIDLFFISSLLSISFEPIVRWTWPLFVSVLTSNLSSVNLSPGRDFQPCPRPSFLCFMQIWILPRQRFDLSVNFRCP